MFWEDEIKKEAVSKVKNRNKRCHIELVEMYFQFKLCFDKLSMTTNSDF